MNFRIYRDTDRLAVNKIFLSNCPKYFVETDRNELNDFLEHYVDENYLVVEDKEKVIGCGGHYTKGQYHGIAWVMFLRGSLGYGRLLRTADLFYQEMERRILAEDRYYDIRVHTTQRMQRLFNRFGFKTISVKKNGFGEGLDDCLMRKVLRN